MQPLSWFSAAGMLPRPRTLRRVAAVLLALAILPTTVLRDRSQRWAHHRQLSITRLAGAPAPGQLGPFRFVGAWQLSSEDYLFGGYSALLARPDRHLLAISDRGSWLEFTEPDTAAPPGLALAQHGHAMSHMLRDKSEWTSIGDAEAAVTDVPPGAGGGHIWLSWEDRNAISRFDMSGPGNWGHEQRAFPKVIRHWSPQFGAEAMARLPDGRFMVVSEDFAPHGFERVHLTLTFPSDPSAPAAPEPSHGDLTADAGYRPTDMVQLPDGRMLILLRRLTWLLPLRFSCRIALADPAELWRTGRWTARTLARLDPPLPTDNFEGLGLRPRGDGTFDVWVISDDNRGATQRTVLLKLALDPRTLPPAVR